MTHSMTAFARTEQTLPEGTLCWEIRSINHRYLEPLLRLPDPFRPLETPLREALRQQLSRGKVECTLHYTDGEGARSLQVDHHQTQQLITAAHQVAALIPEAAPLNPLEILQWPGVLKNTGGDPHTLNQAALQLFKQTLGQLRQHRAREGAELAALIRQRLTAMQQEVATLRHCLPDMLQAQRQKIFDRCSEMAVELDSNRLEQEIVLLAQKSDVAEELDRLDTHIAEVHRVLDQDGATGRRLDFLMQELNREANTLGAKAINTRSTQAAVNLKVLIEQMREQIQNIE